ncbi:TonB-dependent siderophore receptor [Achromobacter denitrificans]|uniref:TonB-dependent siderophore receptor n=1 Tax=Achromobacter denitrificans TaxID=32002 RepID=UPI000F671858|nr:TonB-dependent siderophore receptor [Achromobacter denitrificans]RSE90028.1 TonB-dependent siderophore receptor [Achromobacter denitrificans]
MKTPRNTPRALARRPLCYPLIVGLAIAAPAHAQQSAGGAAVPTLPSINVLGDQTDAATGPVNGYVARETLTGSKTPTSLLEIPQSVSVVGAQEMQDRGVQTVSQAIQYVPGVQISNFGGAEVRNDWIVLRGFDAKITGDYRDGLSQLPYDQIRARTDPYALERVEVIRGPSSVLYGQVAPGGLVNRVTKRPTADAFGEIVLQGGNFDRRQAAFDLGGPIDNDGKYLYRLTGILRDAGTQVEYDSDHRYPDDLGYIAPAFTWRPNADTSFTLLTSYQHDQTDGESRPVFPTHVPVGDYGFNKYDRKQYAIGYLLEHRVNNAFTLRQNARYQHGKLDQRDLYNLRLLADGHTISRYTLVSKESMDGVAIDNQAEYRFNLGRVSHTLLAGLDYRFQDGQQWYRQGLAPNLDLDNPIYDQDIPYPPAANTIIDQKDVSRQLGVYLQDQIKVDNVVVTLGARQDWARSSSDNRLTSVTTRQQDTAFTGRLGLAYLFDSGITPYVSYSTSFLPQIGAGLDSTPFKPTKGEQYEFGIKYQPPGSNSMVALSVFDLTQRNALTPDPRNTNFSVQTGEIGSRGIELEGKANVMRGLDLIASYTLNDVKVNQSNNPAEEGNTPIVTPRHMASAWVNYTLPDTVLQGMGMGVGVRYVGKTYANVANTIENGSSFMVDASLHYQLRNWRFAVDATNLFNKETIVCRNNTVNCRYGLERTVMATAAYRW